MSKQVAEAIVYLADAIKETFGDNPLVVRTVHDEIQIGTDLLETVDKTLEVIDANTEKTSADLAAFKEEPIEDEADEVEAAPEDEVSPAKQKEAVRTALGELQTATDVKTAKTLLNSFDATSIGKLKPEDYQDVIQACKEAIEDA